MTPQFKFLRRVRIHGGECGAVARALHHKVKGSSLYQADSGKALGSTNERIQMSTKTTLKRIALVAVSALGFGLMSVAPSQATYPTTVTLGTPSVAVAGAVGVEQRLNIPLTFTTAAATDTITVSAVITAKPAADTTNALNNVNPIDAIAAGAVTQKTTTTTYTVTASDNSALVTLGAAAVTSAAPFTVTLGFKWTPAAAGSYNIAFFIDGKDATVNPTGLIKSGDPQIKYLSTAVTLQPATTAVLSQPVAGTGAVYNATYISNGIWVKLSATNGTTATTIDGGQQFLVVIPSGLTLRKIAGDTIATTGLTASGTTYAISETDLDINGNAYLNFTAAAAGSYTVTATVSGQSVAAASVALVYKAANRDGTVGAAGLKNDGATAVTPDIGTSTGSVQSAESVFVNPARSGNTFIIFGGTTVGTAAGTWVNVALVDTNRAAHGNRVALTADYVVQMGTTLGESTSSGNNGMAFGSFTVPNTLPASATSTENQYVLFTNSDFDGVVSTASAVTTVVQPETASATNALATVTQTPAASVRVVNGGSITLTAEYVDQYGNAMTGLAVSAIVASGRNIQTTATNLVTNSDGKASFTVTDANSTSTTLTDTVTFTGGATTTFTITYVSALTASTMTTTPSDTTAATAATAASLGAISTTGTASAGRDSITATLKDANGVGIAGIPVTLTLPADVTLHTGSTLVAYTDSNGVATWSVYTTKAGTYAFTFTGGGLTKTSYAKWTAGSGRVVSVTSGTASGDTTPVTIKVVDGYGNGVSGVSLSVSTSGGYFQGAALSSSITTDTNGEIRLVLVGSGTVTATGTETQMTSAAGISTGTTAATGFPAGVNTASLAVTGGVSASTTAAEAATDAAAEAIDAANAATDAANLAAEAADAATVAAEEARDAADAATAAVEELATQVATLMAALKAQITTLANTVAKIAKKVKA